MFLLGEGGRSFSYQGSIIRSRIVNRFLIVSHDRGRGFSILSSLYSLSTANLKKQRQRRSWKEVDSINRATWCSMHEEDGDIPPEKISRIISRNFSPR